MLSACEDDDEKIEVMRDHAVMKGLATVNRRCKV